MPVREGPKEAGSGGNAVAGLAVGTLAEREDLRGHDAEDEPAPAGRIEESVAGACAPGSLKPSFNSAIRSVSGIAILLH